MREKRRVGIPNNAWRREGRKKKENRLIVKDEVLDTLLDQEGLEVDPVDRLEADIPLHKAVRFVNGLTKEQWEAGASLVELLLDAGADPRSVLSLIYPIPPLLRAGSWKMRSRALRGRGVSGVQ